MTADAIAYRALITAALAVLRCLKTPDKELAEHVLTAEQALRKAHTRTENMT